MSADTWTPEGQAKRIEELASSGGTATKVRLIGGSAGDFDERYDPQISGSHPDEKHQ